MATAKTVHGTEYITEPLTKAEIESMQSDAPGAFGEIIVNVAIPVETVMYGIENFDDAISKAATGTICLQDIGFTPIDAVPDNDEVIFQITGWVDEDDLEAYFD